MSEISEKAKALLFAYSLVCAEVITKGIKRDEHDKIYHELQSYIAALEAENASLTGMIDRTVNAWESRCIEMYDEIAKLNGWVDELVTVGNAMHNETFAEGHGALIKDVWRDRVGRIQKEREG